ncbi:MAG: DUF5655 domain-containing protein [Candidatus Eiseniibacteriota bacterium]
MWECARCGRRFAKRNQWHSCARWTARAHREGRSAVVARVYRGFTAAVRSCGPVKRHPAKARIGYIARMTFAAAYVKERWVDVHLILARRMEDKRVRRIESIGGRHVHHFRLLAPGDVDAELRRWIRQAYRVVAAEGVG